MPTRLSRRFEAALVLATRLHATQTRKGGRIPYVSHLLGVASLPLVHGEALWKRFKGGRDGTLWYYRSLVQAFRRHGVTPLVAELTRIVAEVDELAAARGYPIRRSPPTAPPSERAPTSDAARAHPARDTSGRSPPG